MNSSKPYFVSAVYEWIVDNNCTPYILVKADYPGVVVPADFVKDGHIVFNIAMNALNKFVMDKKVISFNARFKGVEQSVYIPMGAVLGIYTQENGKGMMFEADKISAEPETTVESPQVKAKPTLTIVK